MVATIHPSSFYETRCITKPKNAGVFDVRFALLGLVAVDVGDDATHVVGVVVGVVGLLFVE